MPERADAVVVGAGIFGASVAFHLLELGAGDVTLLDRDGVTQATSAAGAGFIDPWAAGSNPFLGPEELAVEHYGLRFYGELAQEDDQVGHRANGCLWLATDEAQWQRLEPILAHGTVETRVLDADAIEALTELVPARAGLRGILHPASGQVSAPGAGRAIVARFVRGGGRLQERRPMLRLLVKRGRVSGVDTPWGAVATDTVVLAAGAWTNQLLAAHGVFLAMVPFVVSRIVTEPLGVPLDTPAMFLPGVAEGEDELGYLYLRGEHGRLLWGAHYDAPPRELFVDQPVPERFDQLPLDGVHELRHAADRAAAVVPLLGRHRSVTAAHGAPCYTPDGRSFVGEVPGIDGLHALAGCNETGVTHAPGFGRALAEHIVTGASSLAPLSPWRLDRFGDGLRSGRDVMASLKTPNDDTSTEET